MREIKFRAWDKKYNVMIQAESFQRDQMWISGIGEVFEIGEWSDYGGGGKTEDDCSDQYILMQYTGLKDKNGKEIYEGDIISTDLDRPFNIVVFRNGAFMFQCHDNGKDYYDYMFSVDEESDRWEYGEVIGNIYDTPELLKGEENA